MSSTVGHWGSKSFMSNHIYLRCKVLHLLPKLAFKIKNIQIGNGQSASVLLIISPILNKHGNRFELLATVSEIHENVDLVLGIKNIFELGDIIN